MSLTNFTVLLFAVILTVAVSADKQYECGYCKYHSECSTHYCHKNKCIYRNKQSLAKCFLDLCDDCHYDSECISERCYMNKCVPKLRPHFKKCFPYKPTPSSSPSVTPSPYPSTTSTASASPSPSPLKANCEPCKYGYECSIGYCTDYYCGTPYTLKHCPTASPSPSMTSSSTPSPSPLKANCEPCKYGYECAIGYCTDYYCGTPYTLKHCPTASPSPSMSSSSTPSPSPLKANCEPCKYGYECAIGYCTDYYCGTTYTLKHCPTASPSPSMSSSSTPSPSPLKADCEPCKYGYECAVGYCSDYFCAKPHHVHKCKKDECESCEEDYECKSDKCKHGICIVNNHSYYKCKY